MMKSDYQATIGIECHVQLKTNSKLFSSADNDAREAAPNTTVSPLCFGLPGTLPVLNVEAINLALTAGLALKSELPELSRFERKHYFYPDLPKGYQITQLAEPVIGPGSVNIILGDGQEKTIRIHHAHLEEDAGKLSHPAGADYSLVDLNRAGTPLIEIVSEPDIHSPEEARAYAEELYLLMTYADVTHGDLYHGNMRFDVNVSVAQPGEPLGTRTETKNLNSFRSVEKAAEYEIKRQIAELEKGNAIIQETRGWNDDKQKTFSQRSKEDANDYRYFPDADIPPVRPTEKQIANIKAVMPTLPDDMRQTWSQSGIDYALQRTVLFHKTVARFLETLRVESGEDVFVRATHWATSSCETPTDILKVSKSQLDELSSMVAQKEVSSSSAKQLLELIIGGDERSPKEIATEAKLIQVNDEAAIESIVDAVLADPASQKAVEDIKAGNEKVIGYLVGQVMKQSKGQANPGVVNQLIHKKLGD